MCTPCSHSPVCPSASAPDHDAARVVSRHPEQGWSLLCNGVVLFEDTGEILPDGQTIAPHRPACRVWTPRSLVPAYSSYASGLGQEHTRFRSP